MRAAATCSFWANDADPEVLFVRRRRVDGGAHCAECVSCAAGFYAAAVGYLFREQRVIADRRSERRTSQHRAGGGGFAAAAASRSPGASLESFRAHAPPLAVRSARGVWTPYPPLRTASIRFGRNVTAEKFEPAIIVGGSFAH